MELLWFYKGGILYLSGIVENIDNFLRGFHFIDSENRRDFL